MSKRFSTTYSNGYTEESSNPYDANGWTNYDDAQTWRLSGAQVTAAEFRTAVISAIEARIDKKLKTHKLISVQHGVTPFARVNKWVRK